MKNRRYALLAAGTAGMLAAAGVAAATVPAAAATTGCTVTYTVQSQWSTGFTANLSVTPPPCTWSGTIWSPRPVPGTGCWA